MDILTTAIGILDDTIPSFTVLLDDFRKKMEENKYITTVNVILGIKLILYIITLVQMSYFYFYKNKRTFSSNVLLKLLITILNIIVVLFIILDIKRFIIR